MSCYDVCSSAVGGISCPQPIADSRNEPCVRQCPDSTTVIQPPPVVVTFPGPILSSFPQNALVGSSGAPVLGGSSLGIGGSSLGYGGSSLGIGVSSLGYGGLGGYGDYGSIGYGGFSGLGGSSLGCGYGGLGGYGGFSRFGGSLGSSSLYGYGRSYSSGSCSPYSYRFSRNRRGSCGPC